MSEKLLEKLLETLRKTEATVVFTKKDGSERTMRCTLNPATIPLEMHPKGKNEQNPNVVAVWDLENDGWRSFIKENLVSFSVTS